MTRFATPETMHNSRLTSTCYLYQDPTQLLLSQPSADGVSVALPLVVCRGIRSSAHKVFPCQTPNHPIPTTSLPRNNKIPNALTAPYLLVPTFRVHLTNTPLSLVLLHTYQHIGGRQHRPAPRPGRSPILQGEESGRRGRRGLIPPLSTSWLPASHPCDLWGQGCLPGAA